MLWINWKRDSEVCVLFSWTGLVAVTEMKLISKFICDGGRVLGCLLCFCSCVFGGFFLILCLQVGKSIRAIFESENHCSTDGVLKEVCASAGFFFLEELGKWWWGVRILLTNYFYNVTKLLFL